MEPRRRGRVYAAWGREQQYPLEEHGDVEVVTVSVEPLVGVSLAVRVLTD